jgi:hypothetical protein
MPGVLTEVGSITYAAEHDLLGSAEGQAAAARGIFAALAGYLNQRPFSVRYDALVADGEGGRLAAVVDGLGPPYWAATLSAADLADGLPLMLTNTGSQAWPAGLRLLAGWGASDQPYLPAAPDAVEPLLLSIPALAPGEAVELRLPVTVPDTAGRQVLWVTLAGADGPWTQMGVAPLQLAYGG